jgi:hypothetical protein
MTLAVRIHALLALASREHHSRIKDHQCERTREPQLEQQGVIYPQKYILSAVKKRGRDGSECEVPLACFLSVPELQ